MAAAETATVGGFVSCPLLRLPPVSAERADTAEPEWQLLHRESSVRPWWPQWLPHPPAVDWQTAARCREHAPPGGTATPAAAAATAQQQQQRQQKRHRHRPPAFASLTTSIASRDRETQLRRTFDEMDVGSKGFVEAADLQAYAKRHRLPAAYVPAFMSAVAAGQPQSGGGDDDAAAAADLQQRIPFDRFQSFVRAREAGLRATFDALDANGDGCLDGRELAAALEAVRVRCPDSRRVYHCRKQAVEELLARASLGAGGSSGRAVSFPEFRAFFLLLPRSQLLADYWLGARCAGLCDIGASVAIHDFAQKGSPWRHLVAGALAGAASRTATAPLETLRLQAMCGASAGGGTLAAARQIVTAAGWRGLYRGNATNVLRSAPQKALDFFAFDVFKSLLHAGSGPLVFAAAGLAGCTTNALLYPLEVVRTRLTADTAGRYTGVADAFRKVAAVEGVSGLYRGLLPSVLGMLPEAAITYGMFDTLKARYRAAHGGAEPPVASVLSFGVASAFCGQLVAFPLETVARRLQVDCASNFAALTARILQEEGPAALYRGVGAASLRVIPMACVSFGTYEVARGAITQWEESRGRVLQPRPGRRRQRQTLGQTPKPLQPVLEPVAATSAAGNQQKH